jgi:integrase
MAKVKLANGTRGKMRDGIRECVGRTGNVTYQIKVPARDAVTGRPSSVWQTFATRTEAREARDKLRSEHHGRPLLAIPKKTSMSVSAWLDAYVAGREKITETTRLNYQNRIRHIMKIVGNLRLADLSSGQIERCKRELDRLDSGTKVGVFALLRTALKAAVAKRLIRTNPTDDVELPKQKRQVRGRAYSPADIAELLSNLAGHETWLPSAVMAHTGIRRGEVCALRRASIDFDRSEIQIRENVARLKRDLIVGPPKTENSVRRIAITADLAQSLRDHLAEQDRIARELGLTPSPDWFVFLPPRGRWNPTEPRCPSALCEALQWRLRNTRFSDFSPHDFRHAHATGLLRAGINPKAVAARIGDTVEVLMTTYAHELPGDSEHAAATFARLMNVKVATSGKPVVPGAPIERQSPVKILIQKAA